MTVREIIEKYLTDYGYDGLAGEDCGCEYGDLGPCDSAACMDHCVAGYRVEVGDTWIITPNKPKGEKDE